MLRGCFAVSFAAVPEMAIISPPSTELSSLIGKREGSQHWDLYSCSVVVSLCVFIIKLQLKNVRIFSQYYLWGVFCPLDHNRQLILCPSGLLLLLHHHKFLLNSDRCWIIWPQTDCVKHIFLSTANSCVAFSFRSVLVFCLVPCHSSDSPVNTPFFRCFFQMFALLADGGEKKHSGGQMLAVLLTHRSSQKMLNSFMGWRVRGLSGVVLINLWHLGHS